MSDTLASDTQIQMTPNQSSAQLGTETILLNYEVGNYYELNEVGSFIWSLLQHKPVITIREIQEQVLDEFTVEPAVCEQEVHSFLANLLHEKLIQIAD